MERVDSKSALLNPAYQHSDSRLLTPLTTKEKLSKFFNSICCCFCCSRKVDDIQITAEYGAVDETAKTKQIAETEAYFNQIIDRRHPSNFYYQDDGL